MLRKKPNLKKPSPLSIINYPLSIILMTKIIAFSGNSNTWKTSAIHYLKDHYGAKHPDLKIHLLHETAREFINENGGWIVEDVHAFEKYIIDQEIKRMETLEKIKKDQLYDLVFIDRTAMDPIIYSYWNMVNGSLDRIDFVDNFQDILQRSKIVYDHVVFFTTPIKIDNRFPIYNNEHINAIFEHTIRYWYKEIVLVYTNNIYFQDNVAGTIFANLFDM